MKNIKLKPATESEWPLIKDCIDKFRLDDENLDPKQFIVAEKDGKISGFGRIKPYGSFSELGCLGVLEPYRNQEIGSAIVNELIKVFPSNEVWITTDVPKYFEKFGFKPTEKAPKELKDKIKGICQEKQHPNAIIMLLKKKTST